ncbi:hypothetical protein BXZ70DRAFT_942753 [Cristinia sonorae]|uniref:F-box domain-containing protein n=1 Tax=Cristinia sonorae TaxID=1940300 RepID=A0A8K0ULY3_9AGAR|nr:hypothetical protein BXZ70DRAFT_942753 [Cristinia sonorae]
MAEVHSKVSPLTAAGIASLPFETFLQIFTSLPGDDIIHFLSTCSSYHALASDESIWRELCLRYGVHDLAAFRRNGTHHTFYSVYSGLLHTYGPLLGLWASDIPFHGAILEFRVVTEEEAGWVGIVGEVWIWEEDDWEEDSDSDEDEGSMVATDPYSPCYYECLRIELVQSAADHASTRFTRVLHRKHADTHGKKDPVLQTIRRGVRLNSPHKQAFYVLNGFIGEESRSHLHPQFPPECLQTLCRDTARLPRLVARDEQPVDHRRHLVNLKYLGHGDGVPLLYYAPSPEDFSTSHSVSIIPPLSAVDSRRYHNHVSPRKYDLPDMMSASIMAFMDTVSAKPAYTGHYFPLPRLPARRPPPGPEHDPLPNRWSLVKRLEGLWVSHSPNGVVASEVVYIHWEEGTCEVQAWKVTGSDCMPRGALSWKFDSLAPAAPADYQRFLTGMAIDVEGRSQDSLLHVYKGIGHTTRSLGYTEEVREREVVVVVVSEDEIRIRWAGVDDLDEPFPEVSTCRRCFERDVARETVSAQCIRRPAQRT